MGTAATGVIEPINRRGYLRVSVLTNSPGDAALDAGHIGAVNASGLRPVALLDVDGNINTAVNPANYYSDPRVPWAWNEELGVRYNPHIVDWIHELHQAADLRWLTSWGHRARTELAPALDLPDFPANVEQEEHRYRELDWKHSSVLSQMVNEPGRPILWLEDEPHYGGAYDQLVPYAKATGTPLFIVQPTISDGLTEAHTLRIRQFLVDHTGSPRRGKVRLPHT